MVDATHVTLFFPNFMAATGLTQELAQHEAQCVRLRALLQASEIVTSLGGVNKKGTSDWVEKMENHMVGPNCASTSSNLEQFSGCPSADASALSFGALQDPTDSEMEHWHVVKQGMEKVLSWHEGEAKDARESITWLDEIGGTRKAASDSSEGHSQVSSSLQVPSKRKIGELDAAPASATPVANDAGGQVAFRPKRFVRTRVLSMPQSGKARGFSMNTWFSDTEDDPNDPTTMAGASRAFEKRGGGTGRGRGRAGKAKS